MGFKSTNNNVVVQTARILLVAGLLYDAGVSSFQVPRDFACRSATPGFGSLGRHHGGLTASVAVTTTQLNMVSKKDKKRMKDEANAAKKREGFQELELLRAQKELVQFIQQAAEKKQARRTIKKQLKDVQHNGLVDIGMEARMLVLEQFRKDGSPSDVVEELSTYKKMLVSSGGASTEDEAHSELLNQYGLWANARLEKWQDAVHYAADLLQARTADPSPTPLSGSLFSSDKENNELFNLAIQAFVETNQNVDRATQLVLEPKSGVLAKQTVNALLRWHVRNKNAEGVENFFHKIQQRQPELLDKDSYGFILDCAAQSGSIALLEEALGDRESLQSQMAEALLDHKPFAKLDKTVGQGRPPTKILLTRIVETLVKAIAISDGKLPQDFQSLASQSVQILASQTQNSILDIAPLVLSRLLVSFENNNDVKGVLTYLRLTRNKKLRWYASLDAPTKVRILSSQLEFEKERGYSKGGDAWHILMSLVTINRKDGTVPDKSREFLQKQRDGNFCYASLTLCALEGAERDCSKLYDAIIQDCWFSILDVRQTDEGTTFDFGRVPWMLEQLAEVPNDKTTIAIFDEIMELMKQTNGFRTIPNDLVSEPYSFDNAKVDLIVRETVWLLRSIPLASASQNDHEKGGNMKSFAILFAVAAMKLVAGMKEFGEEHYWLNDGATNNGAKEALEAIMKELLLSGVIEIDDELVYPASWYYLSIARVSQSSSAIDYEDLLFPSVDSIRWSIEADPYQGFRDCVLNSGVRQEGFKANWLFGVANFLDKVLDGDDFDDGNNEDNLPQLFGSVVAMLWESSGEAGLINFDQFLQEYQSYFIQRRKDLFCDSSLSVGLLLHLKSHAIGRELFRDMKSIMKIDKDHWYELLFTSNFTKSLVDRLQSGRDARFWADYIYNIPAESVPEWVDASSRYLVGLYANAGLINDISYDDKASKHSLFEDYIKGCDLNTRYMVNECMRTFNIKKNGAKKVDSMGWAQFLTSALEKYSFYLSHADQDDALDELKDQNGISLYEIMVNHLLNAIYDAMPDDKKIHRHEHLRALLMGALSDDTLHPKLKDPVRLWMDVVAPQDED